MSFDSILIWNHNQAKLTDRGLRKIRIFGSADGSNWRLLTVPAIIELQRASGAPYSLPESIPNNLSGQRFKSVIIAAQPVGGNYGGDCYGLSAVRFVANK